MDILLADFDEECKMVTGYSYYKWLKNQTKGYAPIFNFCRRCWERESVWEIPSLVLRARTFNVLDIVVFSVKI